MQNHTEYFNFVHHFDLLDATLTRREAAVCFVRSRMAVVNELKSRTKLMQLSFVDFLEVLVRSAGAKALPTDDLLHSAYTSAAGSFVLFKKKHPDEYATFLSQHAEHRAASADEYGQPPARAVEKLLALLATTVGTAVRGGPTAMTDADCAAIHRKDLDSFFEDRGGFSLKRERRSQRKRDSVVPRG